MTTTPTTVTTAAPERELLDSLGRLGIRLGVELTSAQAQLVAERWLKHDGWARDRWGNWKPPHREAELGKLPVESRVVVTSRSYKLQRKLGSSWSAVRTDGIIDWATAKLVVLAKRAGTADEVEAAGSVKERRRAKHVRAKDQRALQDARKTVRVQLVQEQLWLLRERGVFAAHLAGLMPVQEVHQLPDVANALHIIEDDTPVAAQALLNGTWVAPAPPWSLDAPPMPWLDWTAYAWEEDGVSVSFDCRKAPEFLVGQFNEEGCPEFVVGQFGEGLRADPRSFTVRPDWSGNRKGDGFAAGFVRPPGKGRPAEVVLTLIGSLHIGQKPGVGRELVRKVCRLVRGYRADAFVAEALTEEGTSFFAHLVERGELTDLGPVSATGRRYGVV